MQIGGVDAVGMCAGIWVADTDKASARYVMAIVFFYLTGFVTPFPCGCVLVGTPTECFRVFFFFVFFGLIRSWTYRDTSPALPHRFGHKAVAVPDSSTLVIAGGCSDHILSWNETFVLLGVTTMTWQYVTMPVCFAPPVLILNL